MPASSLFPSARHRNLTVEELKNEILIYDIENHQASCLNPTATLVWKYADGKTGVPDIAARMSRDLESPVDARVVWYALEQLDKKHLLDNHVSIPLQYSRMTRRDFLVKAGVVGAAVAIPVIISLTAPTPAMAATCTGACTGGPGQGTCVTGCNCSSPGAGTCGSA